MGTVKVVARWAGVLPAFALGYLLANAFFALSSCVGGHESVTRDLVYSDGLAGHYIMGPLLLAFQSALGVYFGLWMAVRTAPSAKRETAFVLSSVLATICVIGIAMDFYGWRVGVVLGDELARYIFGSVPGSIVGFVFAASVKHGATDNDMNDLI